MTFRKVIENQSIFCNEMKKTILLLFLFGQSLAKRNITKFGTTFSPFQVQRKSVPGKFKTNIHATQTVVKSNRISLTFYCTVNFTANVDLNGIRVKYVSSTVEICEGFLLFRNKELQAMYYLGTIKCPADYPFALNEGLSCCKYHKRSQSCPKTGNLRFLDPPECCINFQSVSCPDLKRKCSKHEDSYSNIIHK